jgi:hypothetical protein
MGSLVNGMRAGVDQQRSLEELRWHLLRVLTARGEVRKQKVLEKA